MTKKKDAKFSYGHLTMSIHTTDDQLRTVVAEEAQKQNRPEDEVFREIKQRRDTVYNATAPEITDRW